MWTQDILFTHPTRTISWASKNAVSHGIFTISTAADLMSINYQPHFKPEMLLKNIRKILCPEKNGGKNIPKLWPSIFEDFQHLQAHINIMGPTTFTAWGLGPFGPADPTSRKRYCGKHRLGWGDHGWCLSLTQTRIQNTQENLKIARMDFGILVTSFKLLAI